MMANTYRRYSALGILIARGRKAAGLEQAELAAAMGASQQSISRWEAGASRPRAREIPKLAQAIAIDEKSLHDAGGYHVAGEMLPVTTTTSLDQLFPVDALAPESFERFVAYLLRYLYPDAFDIRRVGKTGHTQSGVDILVVQRDGSLHSFQCKRVTRFGPAEVEEVVRCHTQNANSRHLVLSRIASPQAAAALRRFSGWALWDKEDITRLIRTRLALVDQLRLVDIFFPGQRQALLGQQPVGPWQKPDEFFAPFAGAVATFSHDWALVGREAEAAKIVAELTAGTNPIVLLSGAGGIGKSRLLKQVAARLHKVASGFEPLFLSPTEQLTAQSLDMLGNEPPVLIVDDAHDRSDLPMLFAFAASRPVRILLATRPYATARLRAQAGQFARGGAITEVELGMLSVNDTTALASEVLHGIGGDPAFAEAIGRATRDCPLVTVLAARIAATEHLPLGLAQNTEAFRDTILGKFATVITGELAPAGEQKRFTDVLKVIALVQPFSMDDAEFRTLVAETTGLDGDTVSATLRTLADGSIIFRRGRRYRLMPDVLGDYIIERTCIDVEDRLDSFAQKVFEAAPRNLLANVLVNLGRLDWRRHSGNASKSQMLDHLWQALKITGDYHDSALEAASAAAFYQPRKAINFVTDQVRKGLRHDELSKILKHAAHNLGFVEEACGILWELGRDDLRDLSQHPGHAMRTLTELCTVEPNKPLAFNEAVVSLGLKLLETEGAFETLYTPFDFLKGVLSGGGHTTEGDNRSITFKTYAVRYDAVALLREQVINAAISHLKGSSLSAAGHAAAFLKSALHFPFLPFSASISDDQRAKYTAEFVRTLATLKELVSAGDLDPAVMIAIACAVAWHANYGNSNATREVAQGIMCALPDTLEIRTLSALVDGFGRIFLGRPDGSTWQARLNKWMAGIVADLATAYPHAADLRRYLETCLERVTQAQLTKRESTNVLVHEILRSHADFALELVQTALQSGGSRLSGYLGPALYFVLHNDRDVGRHWARRFLDSGTLALQRAVGHAYSDPPLDEGVLAPEDREILIRVLGSSELEVISDGLGAFGSLARSAPRLAIDMLRHINLKLAPGLADACFMFFEVNRNEVFRTLEDDDVRYILAELRQLPELNGYWIETVLSHLSLHFPELTCMFFLERTDLASVSDDSSMRPINYGPWVQVPLQFKKAAQYGAVLERVWSWMVGHDINDWRFEHNAAGVFEGMFLPVDNAVIAFLSAKLATATKRDLRWMATVLANAGADFAFTHRALVANFLDACDRAGQPARRKGIDALLRAAISGVRSGRPGEPFPRDLDTIARVEEILPRLPRLSPAYELYDMIREHAGRGIEFQRQQAEFFDDD